MAEPITAIAAIAGLVLQGIGLAGDLSGNEARNRRLRELGLQQAAAEREAGRVAARDFRESADLLRRRADQTRLQAGEFVQEGQQVRGQQSLAFARAGVRLSGSALDRLSETTTRIARGRSRILAAASEQDIGAGRLDRAAEEAIEHARMRAQNAMRGAQDAQRSSVPIGLQGLAGLAHTAANIDWKALGWGASVSPGTGTAGAAGPVSPGGMNYNTTTKRRLLQWG